MSKQGEGCEFNGKGGIRLRCPLAQLLYVLAVDALALYPTQACSQGVQRGYHKISYLEGILLLHDANLNTFLIEGLMEKVRNLSTLLHLFEEFFGLQINQAKSFFVSFELLEEAEL